MLRRIPTDRLTDLIPGSGLTADEVTARRRVYGTNQILESVKKGWRDLARDTARDPMLWFLLATSGMFAITGDHVESTVLLLALLPIIGMDAFLHRRTRAATAGLSSLLATHATVLRAGSCQIVPALDLVPGDLVTVTAGDAFPADGIVESGDNLQVDESALSGEAFPIFKRPWGQAPFAAAGAGVDERHWASAGTRLLTGTATVRVVNTGGETLYGAIVRSVTRGTHARTSLQAAVAGLVTVLVGAAVLLCLTVALVRWQQGHGLLDALLSAVTLAVAALPEEFPVVLTFFLGVGVYRLARRNALVRRAVAVENIGRVTCICSDKTGTITEGRLHLAHLEPAGPGAEQQLLRVAGLASRMASNDPLDKAILDASGDGPTPDVLASFPFTEDRKQESAVAVAPDGVSVALKGAPEVVLAQCSLTESEQKQWLDRVETYAAAGHKVIACASQHSPDGAWHGGEPDRDYSFAGLLAFEDPLRPGVKESLEQCRTAGIRVVMVTGDHPITATAVARELGLGGGAPAVILGETLIARLAQSGDDYTEGFDVVARAVPAVKLELVRALQARGEVVAVTGDGVNDVPALQSADVGIAMGGRGTRAAREVAAIVLIDDNFRSIVRAIAEGGQLFENLQLAFRYLLLVHIPLVLSAALIPLLGYPLLYLPVHIVWLELIIHPTALLAFQNVAGSTQSSPRRDTQPNRFFTSGQWLMILLNGALATAVVTASYLRSLGAGYDVPHARAMAMVVLTVASAGVTAALSGLKTRAARLSTGLTIAATAAIVQIPWAARLLHVSPLHFDDWLIAGTSGLAVAALATIDRLGTAPRFARDPRP
ncbi:MAG: cation-transporting P-type ATPase [Pseudomonadales bacterium]